MPLATRLARDPHFAAAALAAPLAWVALYALTRPPVNPWWPLADPLRFATLVIAWPLFEELVFRGVLQPWLARTRWGARENWGITTANVVTSLVFSAAQLGSHDPAVAAATLLPSLVFGYFRDRYGSIAPGAALHVLYNAGWFLATGA